MTFIKYFKSNYKSYWLISAVICLIIVSIFKTVDICINSGVKIIIENLSYSYIAATIFHIVVNDYPMYKRTSIMRQSLKILFKDIRNKFFMCLNVSDPTTLISYGKFSDEEFISNFDKADLSQRNFLSGNRSISEKLGIYKDSIIAIINSILRNSAYLKATELKQVTNILTSEFINCPLKPDKHTENPEIDANYDSNQCSMGKSLLEQYHTVNKILKDWEND